MSFLAKALRQEVRFFSLFQVVQTPTTAAYCHNTINNEHIDEYID